MQYKILVICQNFPLLEEIKSSLKQIACEIHNAISYPQVVNLISRFNYVFVIIDFDFLGMRGLVILRKLRQLYQTPVLVLSVHATREEEIESLRAGADYYLPIDKPLDTERYSTYAMAIMRRYLYMHHKQLASALISGSGLKINLNLRKAFLDGQDLRLTPKEFAVLCSLAKHMGEVVTKEQLYQDIWENDYDTSPDATLKFHVKELRKKLGRSGAGDLIETAWGIGYILRSDSDISP